LPKVGFCSPFRDPPEVVNVKDLARFPKGTDVDGAKLAEAGLIRAGGRRVKILGEGELKVALNVRVSALSAAARKKIEAAGGTIEVLERPGRGPRGGAGGRSK
jgi:large subunit ribosomal protein L15